LTVIPLCGIYHTVVYIESESLYSTPAPAS
jgi:hypothetical protein